MYCSITVVGVTKEARGAGYSVIHVRDLSCCWYARCSTGGCHRRLLPLVLKKLDSCSDFIAVRWRKRGCVCMERSADEGQG